MSYDHHKGWKNQKISKYILNKKTDAKTYLLKISIKTPKISQKPKQMIYFRILASAFAQLQLQN